MYVCTCTCLYLHVYYKASKPIVKTHEKKVVNITNGQGNINQEHSGIAPIPTYQ